MDYYKYITMRFNELSKTGEKMRAIRAATYIDDTGFQDSIASLDLLPSWTIWSPLLSDREADILLQYARGTSLKDLHSKYGLLGNRSAKNIIRTALSTLKNVYHYLKTGQHNYSTEALLKRPQTRNHMKELEILNKYRNIDLPW